MIHMPYYMAMNVSGVENIMSNNYTPLPAKWTPSSLNKYINNTLWPRFLKDILDNNEWTIEEKTDRINEALKWCQLIYNYTISGEMTYKKK